MKSSKLQHMSLVAVLALLGLSACGGPETTSESTPQVAGEGRLTIRMVDAPGDAKHLWVSVEQISLRPCQGGGWIDAPTVTSVFDLMALADGDAFKTLTQAAFIPLGTYCETRLILGDEATVELESGESYPLKIPSGDSSGYKIKGEYEVKDDALTILTLDFDAEKSLHKAGGSGKYTLDPVVVVDGVEYIDISLELAYTDSLRNTLESLGDSEVLVQVSLHEWMELEDLGSVLAAADAPKIQMLHARSNVLAKTTQVAIPLNGELNTEQALAYIVELRDRTKLQGIYSQAKEIAQIGVGHGMVSSSFQATGPASGVLSWWQSHPDDVRAVQVMADEFSSVQSPLLPGEILK